ncbi:NAD(P)/FAD-dependent oxidoreductase [Marinibaculum pumilum]|uniref:NAD(P)/FAD-dependent oxidoreductase n=1 Tax=Marinibaculum pumilum TaxID=1766165 RepID=A0ABV7KTT4_9PROT
MALSEIVIVGAGQAGLQTAASLRQFGYEGRIRLVGEEKGLPYQRPPLSKAFLKADSDPESLALRNRDFFEKQKIELLDGERVASIDRQAGAVELASGGRLDYDRLVLATGARNRALPVPGGDHPDLLELRSLDHALAVRDRLGSAGSIAIVGGGYIGLEIAATARGRGLDVTVVEAMDRLMPRTASPALSAHVEGVHRGHGVGLRLGEGVARIATDGEGRIAGVETAAGGLIAAELVLVGIGILPNDALAAAAGLETDNGIVVDSCLRTADPSIFALGDCAAFPAPDFGGGALPGRIRLESVQNAVDQAKCVARNILAEPAPYSEVPWFWSDQFDMKIQIAGLTAGSDRQIARLDEEKGRLTVYCFRDGHLAGVETVSNPGDHMACRRLMAERLSPQPAEVEAAGFSLKTWLQAMRGRAGGG